MPELEEKPSEMGWDPRRAFEVVLGVPATDGNAVRVLRNGDEIFPAMLGAIKQAQRSVDLLTFVYWTGDIAVEFADALTERARAGVTVRVLLDALGARRIDEDLVGQMLDAGCDFTITLIRPTSRPVHIAPGKMLLCIRSNWRSDRARCAGRRD